MPSNFPNDPAINDTHTIGNIAWRWNGVAWIGLPGDGGSTGVSIADAVVNTDGDLIITLSDNTSINAG
jgi:hypothetical protein